MTTSANDVLQSTQTELEKLVTDLRALTRRMERMRIEVLEMAEHDHLRQQAEELA